MILFPNKVKVSKSMRKVIRDKTFTITEDHNFLEVILACKRIDRKDQYGTWITNEMVDAYLKLHHLGIAKSIEVWRDNELVGGLYGIDLKDKGVFCGESMFTRVSNASKAALIYLAQNLDTQDYKLIDCQVYTDHLASMGAQEIAREAFLSYL